MASKGFEILFWYRATSRVLRSTTLRCRCLIRKLLAVGSPWTRARLYNPPGATEARQAQRLRSYKINLRDVIRVIIGNTGMINIKPMYISINLSNMQYKYVPMRLF